LLAPACVPPLPAPFAVLAGLLPALLWVAVEWSAAVLVAFDAVVVAYRVEEPWPLDLPSECFVELWAEACLSCRPVSVAPDTAGASSGTAATSSLVKEAGFATRADSGTVSLVK